MIPQDPFLLEGTVKFNLDPYDLYSEEDILSVLKKTQVYDSIESTLIRKSSEDRKEIPNSDHKIVENEEEQLNRTK